VEETIGGYSEKDFNAKMSTACKETRECHYWLRLLYDAKFIDNNAYQSLILDCEELLKIFNF
jgi:four helix bundle protein